VTPHLSPTASTPRQAQAVPIVRVRGSLLVTIRGELHDRFALQLQEAITLETRHTGAHAVVLDLSQVAIIDSYITRILNDIGTSVRYMGARCFVVGIRPSVAMTLVEMGVDLQGVHTRLNLDLALAEIEEV
jgi:rsbT antagonist protein RsbS